jgi:hypothetical protein
MDMYKWIVFLHISIIFIFLIQHAAEISVTFKLRKQEQPDGIFAAYSFLPHNNSRNLRITYSLIIITGAVAGLISPWWKVGWMWTALGTMIVIWIVMNRFGGRYLNAVDAIMDQALKNKNDTSVIQIFRSKLKARREPEIMTVTSVVGMLIILWLMIFKPF